MEQEDSCIAYDGPERRKHCEMVVAIRTAFDADKRDKDEWRRSVERKLEKIISFTEKIEGPYNAGLWAMRLLLGGIITGILAFLFKFIGSHIK